MNGLDFECSPELTNKTPESFVIRSSPPSPHDSASTIPWHGSIGRVLPTLSFCDVVQCSRWAPGSLYFFTAARSSIPHHLAHRTTWAN